MNPITRGVRNAFRNGIRAGSIIGMLALTIGLALSMLLANKAVEQRINKVQSSVGNTITVAPAGIRGFLGGGDALTTNDFKNVKSTNHVTGVDLSLSDRLSSDSTDLQSSIELGNFGTRQFHIEGRAFGGGTMSVGPGQADGQPIDPSNFKPPITVIGASNPLKADSAANGGQLTLTSGHTFDGNKDASVALLGKNLANKNNLKVGSTFKAYDTTFTVSGIFDAGNDFANSQVVMPLITVQKLSDQTGSVTGATVYVDSTLNLESTAKEVQSLFGNKADVTSQAESVKTTLDSLHSIQNVSFFCLIGATATAGVIILLTMVMIVRERRREIGVLKAIGSSNIRVMSQFGVEALTLTILAAVIGVVIGSLGATPVTRLLVNNSDPQNSQSTAAAPGEPGSNMIQVGGNGSASAPNGGFRATFSRSRSNAVEGIRNLKANVDASVLLYGLGGAVLVAALGSTAAAALISRVRPSEVMRSE